MDTSPALAVDTAAVIIPFPGAVAMDWGSLPASAAEAINAIHLVVKRSIILARNDPSLREMSAMRQKRTDDVDLFMERVEELKSLDFSWARLKSLPGPTAEPEFLDAWHLWILYAQRCMDIDSYTGAVDGTDKGPGLAGQGAINHSVAGQSAINLSGAGQKAIDESAADGGAIDQSAASQSVHNGAGENGESWADHARPTPPSGTQKVDWFGNPWDGVCRPAQIRDGRFSEQRNLRNIRCDHCATWQSGNDVGGFMSKYMPKPSEREAAWEQGWDARWYCMKCWRTYLNCSRDEVLERLNYADRSRKKVRRRKIRCDGCATWQSGDDVGGYMNKYMVSLAQRETAWEQGWDARWYCVECWQKYWHLSRDEVLWRLNYADRSRKKAKH